jgi:hypothetical protein
LAWSPGFELVWPLGAVPVFVATVRSYGQMAVARRQCRRATWKSAGQDENAKIVVELMVCPALISVDGKFGWFGEFGKC